MNQFQKEEVNLAKKPKININYLIKINEERKIKLIINYINNMI
jgi:hypothetical protein